MISGLSVTAHIANGAIYAPPAKELVEVVMDPSVAFELAKALFAGISAAAAAVQAWYKYRDAKRAAATFDAEYSAALESKEASDAAHELVTIIPPEVIKDLEARADRCWTGYREVLDGDYLPDEVEHATDAVQGCVCRGWRIHRGLGDVCGWG